MFGRPFLSGTDPGSMAAFCISPADVRLAVILSGTDPGSIAAFCISPPMFAPHPSVWAGCDLIAKRTVFRRN